MLAKKLPQAVSSPFVNNNLGGVFSSDHQRYLLAALLTTNDGEAK